MSIIETNKDLRILIKEKKININLQIDSIKNSTIVNLEKAIEYRTEVGEDALLSELNAHNNIVMLFTKPIPVPQWVNYVQNLRGFLIIGDTTSDIIKSISAFVQITDLLIFNSSFDILPTEIGNLKALNRLYICDCIIESHNLPDSICQLIQLHALIIEGSTITKLPTTIGNLKSLSSLDISDTNVHELPESIGMLKKLCFLDISNTFITTLPDTISNLHLLEHFYLYGLTIDKMPYFPNCVKGRDVFCQVFDQYIPFSLRHQPTSLFNQEPEIIKQYYQEEKEVINSFKVLFLGYGTAGKTHTIQRIEQDGSLQDYDTTQTEGIDIHEKLCDLEGEKIKISFWDFGGQDDLYSMHRCFLTERSCYVVVISNRLHESLQDQATYWLRNIECLAKGSPVVIAVNNSEKSYSEGVDTESLRRQFPNIIIGDAISYSAKCSPANDFNHVMEAILKQICFLDNYKMEFPIKWVNIIKTIQSDGKDYISKKEYRKICEDNGVTSPDIRKWLLSWFHDLGYCFCNHIDSLTGNELEDYQVIDPSWITTAMYRINHAHDAINYDNDYAEEINFEKGTISPSNLTFLIDDTELGGDPSKHYNRKEVGYVLAVMRKFLLSYRISKSIEFIPILCNHKPPHDLYEIPEEQSTVYFIKYEYLPESIVHKLMITLMQRINRPLSKVWRYGFRLDITDAISSESNIYIIAEMNRKSDTLELRILGNDSTLRWEWLQYVLNIINQINVISNCKSIEEYIEKKKNNQTAHLPITSILKAKEKHLQEIWSTDDGEYESYSLTELTGETFGEEIYKNAIEVMEENDTQPLPAIQDVITQAENCSEGSRINLYINGSFYNIHSDTASITQNPDPKQMLSLMDRFLNSSALTENNIDELQEALGTENKELKKQLETAKSKNESRQSILENALNGSKKLIEKTGEVTSIVDDGIDTAKKVANTGKLIIKYSLPLFTFLANHLLK